MKGGLEAQLDERDNNLVTTGAVLQLLLTHPGISVGVLQTVNVVVDEHGNPTNQIDIGLSFMRSTYRLTVERVPDRAVTR